MPGEAHLPSLQEINTHLIKRRETIESSIGTALDARDAVAEAPQPTPVPHQHILPQASVFSSAEPSPLFITQPAATLDVLSSLVAEQVTTSKLGESQQLADNPVAPYLTGSQPLYLCTFGDAANVLNIKHGTQVIQATIAECGDHKDQIQQANQRVIGQFREGVNNTENPGSQVRKFTLGSGKKVVNLHIPCDIKDCTPEALAAFFHQVHLAQAKQIPLVIMGSNNAHFLAALYLQLRDVAFKRIRTSSERSTEEGASDNIGDYFVNTILADAEKYGQYKIEKVVILELLQKAIQGHLTVLYKDALNRFIHHVVDYDQKQLADNAPASTQECDFILALFDTAEFQAYHPKSHREDALLNALGWRIERGIKTALNDNRVTDDLNPEIIGYLMVQLCEFSDNAKRDFETFAVIKMVDVITAAIKANIKFSHNDLKGRIARVGMATEQAQTLLTGMGYDTNIWPAVFKALIAQLADQLVAQCATHVATLRTQANTFASNATSDDRNKDHWEKKATRFNQAADCIDSIVAKLREYAAAEAINISPAKVNAIIEEIQALFLNQDTGIMPIFRDITAKQYVDAGMFSTTWKDTDYQALYGILHNEKKYKDDPSDQSLRGILRIFMQDRFNLIASMLPRTASQDDVMDGVATLRTRVATREKRIAVIPDGLLTEFKAVLLPASTEDEGMTLTPPNDEQLEQALRAFLATDGTAKQPKFPAEVLKYVAAQHTAKAAEIQNAFYGTKEAACLVMLIKQAQTAMQRRKQIVPEGVSRTMSTVVARSQLDRGSMVDGSTPDLATARTAMETGVGVLGKSKLTGQIVMDDSAEEKERKRKAKEAEEEARRLLGRNIGGMRIVADGDASMTSGGGTDNPRRSPSPDATSPRSSAGSNPTGGSASVSATDPTVDMDLSQLCEHYGVAEPTVEEMIGNSSNKDTVLGILEASTKIADREAAEAAYEKLQAAHAASEASRSPREPLSRARALSGATKLEDNGKGAAAAAMASVMASAVVGDGDSATSGGGSTYATATASMTSSSPTSPRSESSSSPSGSPPPSSAATAGSAPPPPPMTASPSATSAGGAAARPPMTGSLLSGIADFNKSGLKKTETVDKSAPKTSHDSGTSDTANAGSNPLARDDGTVDRAAFQALLGSAFSGSTGRRRAMDGDGATATHHSPSPSPRSSYDSE